MREVYFASILLTGGVCLAFAMHALMLARQSRQRVYLWLTLIAARGALLRMRLRLLRELRPEVAIRWDHAVLHLRAVPAVHLRGARHGARGPGRARPRWFRALPDGEPRRHERLLHPGRSSTATWAPTSSCARRSRYDLVEPLHAPTLRSRPSARGGSPGSRSASSSSRSSCSVGIGRAGISCRSWSGVWPTSRRTSPTSPSSPGIYDMYYVQHLGFAVLVIGCWSVLARRYELSLLELSAAVGSLEERGRRLGRLAAARPPEPHRRDRAARSRRGPRDQQPRARHHELRRAPQEAERRPAGAGVRRGDRARVRARGRASSRRCSRSRAATTSSSASVTARDMIEDVSASSRIAMSAAGIEPRVDIADDVPDDAPGRAAAQAGDHEPADERTDALGARDPKRGGDKVVRIVASKRASAGTTWLVIETIDNADGIEPALIDRIFDPFFTTKAPGRGTGLGLAISQEIVAGYGGQLTCRSERGEGTGFAWRYSSDRRLRPVARGRRVRLAAEARRDVRITRATMSSLRSANVARLGGTVFDVLVVGGGINGAVSAACLAARGARVALIDRGDFAVAHEPAVVEPRLGRHQVHGVARVRPRAQALPLAQPPHPQLPVDRPGDPLLRRARAGLPARAAGSSSSAPGSTGSSGASSPGRRASCARAPSRARSPSSTSRAATAASSTPTRTSTTTTRASSGTSSARALDYGCIAANYVESLGSQRGEDGVWVTRARDV